MLTLNATFIFVFISFAVFVFLMKLICYAPITKVIEEREKFYKKNQKTTDETNSKKEEVLKEVEEEISSAKKEGAELLLSASNKNKEEKEALIKNKKAEILKSVQEYEETLNSDSKTAKAAIRGEIEEYVKLTVSKVLGISPDSVKTDNLKTDEVLK